MHPMPPAMIAKIDKIAQNKNISFAEVVREAVDAFDSELSSEDVAILEALADTMIKTSRDVIKKIDAIEKRLDETHTILEGN